MRVLITDGYYKHTAAIARYLLRYDRTLRLSVHDGGQTLITRINGGGGRRIVGGPLARVLEQRDFDLVIPVGASSVALAARVCPEKAVLPPLAAIETCLSKAATAELAEAVGVPVPRTWAPGTMEEALSLEPPFPCVLKPGNETLAKFTCYPRNRAEYLEQYRACAGICRAAGGPLPLVQEFVSGRGVGFFGLYDRGVCKWVFMHRRIRELPVTGGPSTAAEAFYHPRLREFGVTLLDALQWHGVAMVEMKYDEADERFRLIEINPKFWGSTELALRAGVNFPAGVLRIFRGEDLEYSERYDRDLRFYWPLPDDLRVLRQTHALGRCRDYFRAHSATNLFHYPLMDLVNLGRLILR